MTIQWRLSLAAGVLSLALAGCGTQPAKTTLPTSRPLDPLQQVEQLLRQADSAQPIEAARLKAQAANLLLKLEMQADALKAIENTDLSLLPPSLRFEIARLKAAAALEQQQPAEALRYLAQPPGNRSELPPAESLAYSQLRAAAYGQQADWENQARELIYSSLLEEEAGLRQQLHDQIWSLLQRFPLEEINTLIQGNNSYYEQGWFELAQFTRNSRGLAERNEALAQWKILWGPHPANLLPPQEQTTASVELITTDTLAIVLPESGDLAKPAQAIREGLLAAHFAAQQNGNPAPRLIFIDASQISTPQQLLLRLDELQAGAAIGPLQKEYVTALAASAPLPVPFLALNTSQSGLRNQNLFQFGLSADDEARQAAERMWQDGHRIVLGIAPETSWGARALDAFKTAFEALGGQVAETTTTADHSDFSERIAALLATDKSLERAQLIRSLSTQKIQFEERRRGDADAIFMSAIPEDARQLKPILDFHYAADLPIYATSHIFAGGADSNRDRDLNGIVFCATPWNLRAPSAEKLLLSQRRQDVDDRFGRLYALGLDAYRLYPYLQQMAASPDSRISGETGSLSLNSLNEVQRRLDWAVYRNGTPKLLQ